MNEFAVLALATVYLSGQKPWLTPKRRIGCDVVQFCKGRKTLWATIKHLYFVLYKRITSHLLMGRFTEAELAQRFVQPRILKGLACSGYEPRFSLAHTGIRLGSVKLLSGTLEQLLRFTVVNHAVPNFTM